MPIDLAPFPEPLHEALRWLEQSARLPFAVSVDDLARQHLPLIEHLERLGAGPADIAAVFEQCGIKGGPFKPATISKAISRAKRAARQPDHSSAIGDKSQRQQRSGACERTVANGTADRRRSRAAEASARAASDGGDDERSAATADEPRLPVAHDGAPRHEMTIGGKSSRLSAEDGNSRQIAALRGFGRAASAESDVFDRARQVGRAMNKLSGESNDE
jgi:hypothetical protein